MTFTDYQALCEQAFALLASKTAIQSHGPGSCQLNDVDVELLFDEGPSVLSVVCHLGRPAEAHRTQVYEQLLYLQLLSLHMPGLRFGYDPKLDEVMFCSSAKVDQSTPGTWLANLMLTMARQARTWRDGMLSGQMVDLAAELEADLLDN